VSSVIVGARDPHRLEAKPSFISRAAGADLWLATGLELELAYEVPILRESRNPKIQIGAPGHVYSSDWVKIREIPTGAVTRAQGDLHPYGNPHIWLDPYNGRTIALKLADKMGSLDKANADSFDANAKAFVNRLDDAMFGSALVNKFGGATLWQWDNDDKLVANLKEKGADSQLGGWAAKMRPYWKSPIVTYHRSWTYFAFRFGLKVIDELEPKPGIDPTPGHVGAVIKEVTDQHVKVILQEPFYSPRTANFVAQKTGASAVIAPGNVGHTPGAKDYISMFDEIVGKVSAAMGK
jgi:ABC-type Zn uptake system ZnuABC Zn-binding protein ZnuA